MLEAKPIYDYQPHDRVGEYILLGWKPETSGDFFNSIHLRNSDEFVCWHLYVLGELMAPQVLTFINLLSGQEQPPALLDPPLIEPRPHTDDWQTHIVFYGLLPGQFLPDQYEPHRVAKQQLERPDEKRVEVEPEGRLEQAGLELESHPS